MCIYFFYTFKQLLHQYLLYRVKKKIIHSYRARENGKTILEEPQHQTSLRCQCRLHYHSKCCDRFHCHCLLLLMKLLIHVLQVHITCHHAKTYLLSDQHGCILSSNLPGLYFVSLPLLICSCSVCISFLRALKFGGLFACLLG